MVINRHGKMFFGVKASALRPSQISGIEGHFINSTTDRAAAMKSSEKANKGYILPIILSMGNIVAMM